MNKESAAISRAISRAIDAIVRPFWPLQSLSRRAGPADAAWWEQLASAVIVLAMLVGLAMAVNRAVEHGGTDFWKFHRSGKYLLTHGVRDPHSETARYLPSADVPWMLPGALPVPAAACLYHLLGCWSWFALLDAIGRYLLTKCDEATRRRILLLVGLMVLPLAINGLCGGSFHIIMVWLMVAGLGLVARGRLLRGGLVLGLAVWVKLLPAVGVGYLLLKRKFAPAVLAVIFVVALDVVLSLAAFGPKAAWEEHVKWWHNEGTGSVGRQLNRTDFMDEDRLTNQSILVVMRRTLTSLGSDAGIPTDNVPLDQLHARNQVRVANLSPEQLKWAYYAVLALLGAGIAFVCRRHGDEQSDGQWATEIALMLLATMWFSPVVWGYYPTAVTPALALVLSHGERHRRVVQATVAMWLLGMALMAVPAARAAGVLTWASLLLGAVLVWMQRDDGRHPVA